MRSTRTKSFRARIGKFCYALGIYLLIASHVSSSVLANDKKPLNAFKFAAPTVMRSSIEARYNRAVIRRTFLKLGIPVEEVFLPINRREMMMRKGLLDGDSMRIREFEKVDGYVRIPVPLMTNFIAALTHNEHLKINTMDDLLVGDYKISFVKTRSIINNLPKGITPERLLVQNISVSNAFRQLHEKHIKVLLVEYPDFSENDFLRSIVDQNLFLSEPLHKVNLYFYIHTKHEALAPSLTQALREVVTSGEVNIHNLNDSILPDQDISQ